MRSLPPAHLLGSGRPSRGRRPSFGRCSVVSSAAYGSRPNLTGHRARSTLEACSSQAYPLEEETCSNPRSEAQRCGALRDCRTARERLRPRSQDPRPDDRRTRRHPSGPGRLPEGLCEFRAVLLQQQTWRDREGSRKHARFSAPAHLLRCGRPESEGAMVVCGLGRWSIAQALLDGRRCSLRPAWTQLGEFLIRVNFGPNPQGEPAIAHLLGASRSRICSPGEEGIGWRSAQPCAVGGPLPAGLNARRVADVAICPPAEAERR